MLMKQNRLTLACLLSALLAGLHPASAVSSENPYLNTVTNRNLFSLKPPPDPATLVPQVQAPPLPNVMLAGITTLMGNPRAILRVPRPARPPEPAKEVSLFLSAGAPAEEGVQVLEINVAAGTVKIVNQGTQQDLDIVKNAPKAGAAPAPAPGTIPVPPPRPGGVIPAPPPTPGVPAVTSFGRPIRGSGASGSSTSVLGGGPGQMADPNAPPPVAPVEEQIAMMAILHEQERAKVAAGLIKPQDMMPYPPTELNEPEDQGNSGVDSPQLPQ